MQPEQTHSFHIVGGEKGGVGKSLLARLLAAYYSREGGQNPLGFDADTSNPSFSRFYPQLCHTIDPRHQEQLDHCLEAALTQDQHVIVDLPSQSTKAVEQWWHDINFFDLVQRYNINLYYWFVCDDSFDSMQLLTQFTGRYAQQLRIIVLKNNGRGAEFSAFDHLQGVKADLPCGFIDAFDRSALYTIDQHSLSFETALASNSPLASEDKQLLQAQLDSMFLQLDAFIAPEQTRLIRLYIHQLQLIQRQLVWLNHEITRQETAVGDYYIADTNRPWLGLHRVLSR